MSREDIRTCALAGAFLLAALLAAFMARQQETQETQLNQAFLVLKQALSQRIDTLCRDTPQASGVLKAMVTGDRSSISRDVTQTFRTSGASHLIAISGLHIGMFYSVIGLMFLPLGRSKAALALKGTATLALVFTYAATTGMGNSVARAFIMACVNETSAILGRKQHLLHTLAVSAVIALSVNPRAAADLSFQLSYAAVAGIALIYPYLRDAVSAKTKAMKSIWNSIAISVSCQVTTLPLTLWHFGYFPKYFIVTNLLSIPLASVSLACMAASLFAGAFWEQGALLLAKASAHVMQLVIDINRTIATLP